MKDWKSKAWHHHITGTDGDCQLFGVNIFNYPWVSTGEKASVADPIYQQAFKFPIYTVVIDGKTFEFAAGEFSNCVWGFYLKGF